MKFVALFIALAAAFPISLLMRSSPMFRRMVWTIFGALPFLAQVLPMFDIGLLSWSGQWIGFVYGLEINLIDILAVAALLSFTPGRVPLWCKLPALFYLFAAGLSLLQADQPVAASFGLMQIARMVLTMVVVARACQYPRVALFILQGMALGMGAHLVAVLDQRFVLGLTQAHGLFIHQNTLGMTAHLVLLPFLALLMHGFSGTKTQIMAIGATIIVVILTASRAAIGFSALGIALVFAIMALAGLTQRKMLMALVAVVALAIVSSLAISSLSKRFEASPLSEDQYDERAAFNRAATFILSDHPMGIGLNHYVHVAKNYGYSERAGVYDGEGNRNNIVHNAYLLAAAETGYLGLFAYCIMLAVPLFSALTTGWRFRTTAEGSLLLGFGAALLVIYLHSFYEWVVFGKEVQYLLFMTMGMVFGVSVRMRALSATRQRKPSTRSIAVANAIRQRSRRPLVWKWTH